ncbi:MAG: hypothetical protein ACMVY4_04635 [Minwuia sp.]|uniref:hypothetical protein n=1 Tax=Minwuia sp. TaxID=2493630 RepID=UPI003A86B8CD
MYEVGLIHTGRKILADVVVVSPEHFQQLIDESAPRFVSSATALVDTGAELSCISARFAQLAEFAVVGKRGLRSASGVFEHNEYYFHLGFQPATGPVLFYPHAIRGPDFDAAADSYDLLIGMDVISTGVLTVGPGNQASFRF